MPGGLRRLASLRNILKNNPNHDMGLLQDDCHAMSLPIGIGEP